jgi:hypothetical protein
MRQVAHAKLRMRWLLSRFLFSPSSLSRHFMMATLFTQDVSELSKPFDVSKPSDLAKPFELSKPFGTPKLTLCLL